MSNFQFLEGTLEQARKQQDSTYKGAPFLLAELPETEGDAVNNENRYGNPNPHGTSYVSKHTPAASTAPDVVKEENAKSGAATGAYLRPVTTLGAADATLSMGKGDPASRTTVSSKEAQEALKKAGVALQGSMLVTLGNDYTMVPAPGAEGSTEKDGSAPAQVTLGRLKDQLGAAKYSEVSLGDSQVDYGVLVSMVAEQRAEKMKAIDSNTNLTPEARKSLKGEVAASYTQALGSLTSLKQSVLDPAYVSTRYSAYVGKDPAPASSPSMTQSADLTQYVRTKVIGYHTKVQVVDAEGTSYSVPSTDGGTIDSLILGMSPDTLSVASTKLINRYQTLTRWVEEHWGDDLDQLSFSGSTFGFMSAENGFVLDDTRRDSGAYKELKHLVDIYKQNGCIYQEANDPSEQRLYRYFYSPDSKTPPRQIVEHPRAGMVKKRLYVQLAFDFAIFTGYFESFTVEDSADTPFTLKYSVSFKAEKTQWF